VIGACDSVVKAVASWEILSAICRLDSASCLDVPAYISAAFSNCVLDDLYVLFLGFNIFPKICFIVSNSNLKVFCLANLFRHINSCIYDGNKSREVPNCLLSFLFARIHTFSIVCVNVTVIWNDEVLFVDDDLVIVYLPTKVFNIAVSPPSIRNYFCAGKYIPNGFFNINKLQSHATNKT
jgi:hypothetical protein